MGVVNIKFPADEYQQVSSGELSINDLYTHLLFDTVTHQHILTQLQNYHSDEDGAPIVPGFDIADIDFDAQTHTGKIRLNYQADYTFACADRRSTTKHTETSDFIFYPASETITLFIHDKISRDTIDEF